MLARSGCVHASRALHGQQTTKFDAHAYDTHAQGTKLAEHSGWRK
jgi:hypothetical protein